MRHIVLTLGPLGAALCTLSQDRRSICISHLPAPPAKVVNSSGAGDCLVAGCAAALLAGAQPLNALAHGQVCILCCASCEFQMPAQLRMRLPCSITQMAVDSSRCLAQAAARCAVESQQNVPNTFVTAELAADSEALLLRCRSWTLPAGPRL